MVNKKKQTKVETKKRKEVIMILDSSGSMNQKKSDVMGSYNNFIKEQQEIKDDTLFYLYMFSSSPVPTTYKLNGVTVDKLEPLTDKNYTPKGQTALTDAICYCVCDSKNKDTERFYVIYTDGEENDSRENSSETLKKLIADEEGKGNKFEYMCASLDRFTLDSTQNYAAFVGLAKNYRSTGTVDEMFSHSTRSVKGFRTS